MIDPQALRETAKALEADGHSTPAGQMQDAADDIERLRKVVADLRVKLQSILERLDDG